MRTNSEALDGKIERQLTGYPCPFYSMAIRCKEGNCYICSGEYLEIQRNNLREYYAQNNK